MKLDTNCKTKDKRNFGSWILYFILFRSVMANPCSDYNGVYNLSVNTSSNATVT